MDLIGFIVLSQVILVPILGLQLMSIRAERQRNQRTLRNSLMVLARKYR